MSDLKSRVETVAASLKDTSPKDAAVLQELLSNWDSLPPTPAPKKAASEIAPVNFARIEFDYLEQFMNDVLVAAGVPQNEAKIAADVLIYADKRGIDSHGIGRLKPIYIQRILAGILKPTAEFTVVKESDTTAVVDGNGGLGLYIGPRCMDMCIEKAKKFGVAMVVARNSTHYGAAGWYVNRAQEKGCIGITGTNARYVFLQSPLHFSFISDSNMHISRADRRSRRRTASSRCSARTRSRSASHPTTASRTCSTARRRSTSAGRSRSMRARAFRPRRGRWLTGRGGSARTRRGFSGICRRASARLRRLGGLVLRWVGKLCKQLF